MVAAARWSYQSTASSSSWMDAMARCRSIVSDESSSTGSWSPTLFAMDLAPRVVPSAEYAPRALSV